MWTMKKYLATRFRHGRLEPAPKWIVVLLNIRFWFRSHLVEFYCNECGWRGKLAQASFGHDDFYCPSCLKEVHSLAME